MSYPCVIRQAASAAGSSRPVGFGVELERDIVLFQQRFQIGNLCRQAVDLGQVILGLFFPGAFDDFLRTGAAQVQDSFTDHRGISFLVSVGGG